MSTPPATAYVPTPRLTLNGAADAGAMNDLTELMVEDTSAGMSRCEATFGNWGLRDAVPDYLYLSGDRVDLGSALTVSFAADGPYRPVFAGRVSALRAEYPASHPARLLVHAEDGLQGMRLTRRTRTFADATTADLVARIAREHGLAPDVRLDGPSRAITAQLNQSDLAFLRGLARSEDGEVWLEDGTLHARRRPDRPTDTADPVRLDYGGNLLSFAVRADLAHQVTEVAVTGWSVADKAAIREAAGPSELAAELSPGQRSGSSMLAATFGDRSEGIVRSAPLSSADARALARAAYLGRARRFVCGTGTTAGNPEVRVGARATLGGLGAVFDGDYTVCRVRHEYDLAQGYRTEFDVERAGWGTP